MHTKSFIRIFAGLLGALVMSTHAHAATTLTWNECVREMFAQNPELRAAGMRLHAAGNQYKGAYSGFWPQISGSLSYNYGNGATIIDPSGAVTSGNGGTAAYSLSATHNLFSGLADRARVLGANGNQLIARATLQMISARVMFELKSAFAKLQYAQQAAALAHATIARRQENLQLIELRYETGRENQGSLLLSKAYLQQAHYDAVQAIDAVRVAREQLAKTLGRAESGDWQVVGNVPLQSVPRAEEIRTLAKATPEYAQALAQRTVAAAAVTTARAPMFPSLNVTGATNQRGESWSRDNNRWSIGASLSWPLFSGGRDYFATKSALDNFTAAKVDVEHVEHQAIVRLEQARADFLEATERVKVDASFLTAVRVREEIARRRYENGLLSFEEWDIIENDLINREKNRLASARDRVVNGAAWEQAIGQGAMP